MNDAWRNLVEQAKQTSIEETVPLDLQLNAALLAMVRYLIRNDRNQKGSAECDDNVVALHQGPTIEDCE